MIVPFLKAAGLYVAGIVAEQVVQGAVERLTASAREGLSLDLRPIPHAEVAEYVRVNPGDVEAAAFARAAMKHLLAHPAHAAAVVAALCELGRVRAENTGCSIFVHNTTRP